MAVKSLNLNISGPILFNIFLHHIMLLEPVFVLSTYIIKNINQYVCAFVCNFQKTFSIFCPFLCKVLVEFFLPEYLKPKASSIKTCDSNVSFDMNNSCVFLLKFCKSLKHEILCTDFTYHIWITPFFRGLKQ